MWHVHRNGAWSTALPLEEILKRISEGSFSWAHFAVPSESTVPGGKPQRLCQIAAFSAHVPPPPSDVPGKVAPELKKAVAAAAFAASLSAATSASNEDFSKSGSQAIEAKYGKSNNTWFIQYSGSEFGPLRFNELAMLLKSGKIKGNVYGWRKGFVDWLPVDEITELKELLEAVGYLSKEEGIQKRKSKRIPFLATIKVSLNASLHPYFIGVCLDISAGGVKILCDFDLGQPGTHLYLRVNPAGVTKIPAFNVEAETVRALTDRKGFAVRFLNLDPSIAQVLTTLAEENTEGKT